MKTNSVRLVSSAFTVCVFMAGGWRAGAEDNRVRFPESFESGVHYATVRRGNIVEELYTSREAIDAVKNGRPIPDGTVIAMTDTRDGRLYRYVVMQKGQGWGSDVPPQQRTGDWQFQWFNPDRTVKADESLARCHSCHQSQASQDFVFTLDRMRNVE